ncbi:beta-N-acetylhexosaminidase [Sandaracinobacter sp. RS1-74]|uniref:beta-N-acetylhexosaminidase n=1 Tax=Sandaracinobacteroides sayramensis TaxID=2913411 RepID=UPI001EDBBA85|nr:family 20 glycosylhydrolase [Sandaracinobacteroides sayramensis]MCG2840120.1 beta-N-acetylhexosaminidase [Sandaracinobacteroides sayramensis]
MPHAIAVSPNGEKLGVSGPFLVQWKGCGPAEKLDAAARRFQSDVDRQTGLRLQAGAPVPLRIGCLQTENAADRGEAYRLEVRADGVAIEADGSTGALRALATLRQLVGLSPDGIRIPLQRIDDKPRFAWRGVLLDPARNFISIETLKRQIDAMERVKLNTLHLHLSDDQGFRVESRRYPRLNAGGPFYTQADIRELIGYAEARGVRIIPEFDVPGHSRAMVEAYPEIGVLVQSPIPGLKAAALNPASPAMWRFLEGLFAEMAALFPDPHFHAGGDEVSAGVWKDAPGMTEWIAREGLADQHAVESWFARRAGRILKAQGKTMIGWEEMAAAGVDKNVVVQAWQTSNAMANATAGNHPTLMSAGYYLNLLMPAEYHYALDPAQTSGAGLTPDHAATLRKLSPLLAAMVADAQVDRPRAPLTPEQERNLLGGEMALWGEIATDELIDHQLWPRAAALAERFWSNRSVRDIDDMYARLTVVSAQLSASGVRNVSARTRMIERLAPADPEALATLLEVAGPVRNMAHDHRIRAMLAGKTIVQSLNAPADAAPVDSLVARRFTAEAKRLAAGERALAPQLAARLAIWQANDTRFKALAKGHPMLEEALPTSAQLAALAKLGLDAVAALDAGEPLAASRAAEGRALLETLRKQEAASWRPFDPFISQQPPADLILKIGPGLEVLLEAAVRAGG